jgi:hypothetical protein
MATTTSVLLALAVKVAADTNVDGTSSYTIDRGMEDVTAGQSVAFIAGYPSGYDSTNSNTRRVVSSFVITVAYKLTAGQDESVYTTDDLLEDLVDLMDPEFYRAVTGVYDLHDVPELTLPTRVGNVIEYTVTVPLVIQA